MSPETEPLVRKWLSRRLAGTRIVLNNTPPLHAMARTVEVDPERRCEGPGKSDGLDGVDDMEGGAV